MRNRLNVHWQGKRTTARFPAYLWRLALIASGCSDDDLSRRCRFQLLDSDPDISASASDDVIFYLTSIIEEELTLAGFNPGTSRAHGPGRSPAPTAAEARKISDSDKSPRG